MRAIEAELYMKSYEEFALSRGLQNNGPTQAYFTKQVHKYAEPYTPRLRGVFMANVDVNTDNIHYKSPFSNYLWRGKKFVDPKYHIGAFFNESYGFWSRPGVLKEETDIDLEYTDSPLRGPQWINRMWPDKGDEIINNTQNFMNRGANNG